MRNLIWKGPGVLQTLQRKVVNPGEVIPDKAISAERIEQLAKWIEEIRPEPKESEVDVPQTEEIEVDVHVSEVDDPGPKRKGPGRSRKDRK